MAKQNFPRVMAEVFKHEGGYADHPEDPGGATNFGITHKTLALARGVAKVTKADVKALTREEAEGIYRRRYWAEVQGDALPYGFDLVAMDGAVNSGPARGIKWLQKGLKVPADGKVGPVTIEAAYSAPVKAIERACAARMAFLEGLKTWSAFGKGWGRRVASVEAVAVRMWLSAAEGTQHAREALSEAAKDAPARADKERRSGASQAGATGAGGAGGVTVADMPPEAAAALALGVAVAVALLLWAARRRAAYQEQRAMAYAAEAEALA